MRAVSEAIIAALDSVIRVESGMSVMYEETTLPNGLTIAAESDPSAQSVGVGFFVKTGARDEAGEVMGVSHFLEHMMFKGTDRNLSADDVNRGFDDLGAQQQRVHLGEMTCFYAHVLPEHLPEAATGLLAEMMRPALREDDFETERGVILEEIAMYDDNPVLRALRRNTRTALRGPPPGPPRAGHARVHRRR